jgi:DNA-binding NtrC family response regulator
LTEGKSRITLLVIDDDRSLCDFFKEEFESDTLEVLVAHTGKSGLDICSRRKIDILMLDQKLPDTTGESLCGPILEYNDQTKIVFITAFPNFQNALRAIKTGAYDYISKPFDLDELHLAINRIIRTIELEKVDRFHSYRYKKEKEENYLTGKSKAHQDITKMIDAAASAEAPLLITGETGTGKNLVAKIVHLKGKNPKSPFVRINCASLPETLIEAELFGYEKGAFTGAVSSHKGVFEIAEGGTLLLDEIGAMPIHLQSKLLGILDDKKYRRLGGNSDRSVNVRIIAATNAPLETMTREKTFREDLYFRLNVLTIHLPPLRERLDDLPDLCSLFIDSLIKGRKKPELPDSEMEKLRQYGWPGNIRELKNLIERSTILHKDVLTPSDFIDTPPVSTGTSRPSPPGPVQTGNADHIYTLEEMEKEHIRRVFEICGGNYSKSARVLGISLSTFRRKINRYQPETVSK